VEWFFDAVGWVIWPVKIVPEMTYKVSSGTLNLCSLTTHGAFVLEGLSGGLHWGKGVFVQMDLL